jgi:hypothetical protein
MVPSTPYTYTCADRSFDIAGIITLKNAEKLVAARESLATLYFGYSPVAGTLSEKTSPWYGFYPAQRLGFFTESVIRSVPTFLGDVGYSCVAEGVTTESSNAGVALPTSLTFSHSVPQHTTLDTH